MKHQKKCIKSNRFLSFTSTFLAIILVNSIIIPPANALLPSPREGECDAAIFPPFPDRNIGPGSLKSTIISEDPKLKHYIKNKKNAIILGKALFWDMQIGSDGKQACGTCHFRAGADSRSKNQLSPGGVNNNSGKIDLGGPNLTLTAEHFPLLLFADRTDRNSTIIRQTDDTVASMGIHARTFKSAKRGKHHDKGDSFIDPIFNINGINLRRVEPRNTPTIINAALYNKNFWDGRANNLFNGVNEFGAGDSKARVLKAVNGKLIPVKVRLDFSSLASQAVGPIVSNFEMSYFNRTQRDVGKRALHLRPLDKQKVHPQDSVLGVFAKKNRSGLTIRNYATLVRQAFHKQWWDSNTIIRIDEYGNESFVIADRNHKIKKNEYTLMENNFSLFFGLAIQEYEKTLISDDAKIDQHFENLNAGGSGLLNEQELRGEMLFSAAACAACHSGPELTSASVRTSRQGFENPKFTPSFQPPEWFERMYNGNCDVVVYEQGFYNIGVRPTIEDLGAGAKDPFGNPLSVADIVTSDPADIPSQELLTYEYANIADPAIGPGTDRAIMKGAFKIPSLRNVELTAPYFHNGGQHTLRQVIEFYNRGGDFHDLNSDNMDFEIGKLGLTENEITDLISFIKTFTDERVRKQQAPFDHPELFVPNGSQGDTLSVESENGIEADDEILYIPAVGKNGGPLAPAFLQ